MAAATVHKSGSNKRLMILLVLIILIAIVYTIGWFYVANKLETRARSDIARMNEQGMGVQCEDLRTGGFPVRVNVICDSVSWQRPEAGMAFHAGYFASGAPVYAPWSLTNRMSGPAFIEFPGITPLEVNWSNFTSNARLAKPVPTEIALSARDVVVGLRTDPSKSEPIGKLEQMDFSVDGSGDLLKLNGRFSGFKLQGDRIGIGQSPEFDGLIDLDISDAASLLSRRENDLRGSLRGHGGTIRQAFISTGSGAMVSVDGNFTIDLDGLVDGDLKLKLVNPQALAAIGQNLFPAQGGNIATMMFAMNAMPKDENGNPTLPIAIRKGKMQSGFIPLGRLPVF